MPSPRRRAVSVFSLLVLVGVLSGCAMTPRNMGINMGIRPDEPQIGLRPVDGKPGEFTKVDVCYEYGEYALYAQDLQVSYHSRATQNRGWIYVAGILGLGVMAASGGLAIASTAAAGTLGLLSISGGFAASSFAVINNEALALSYTVAANNIDQALRDSRERYLVAGSCSAALQVLIVGVSNTRTHLEVARTDNAAGAMARARDQMTLLNKQINDQLAIVQAADITSIILTAEVTKVEPPKEANVLADREVVLTVRAKLGGVGTENLKVALASTEYDVISISQPDTKDPSTFKVKFKFPAPAAKTPPDPVKAYSPELVVRGKGGTTRVKSSTDVTFTY